MEIPATLTKMRKVAGYSQELMGELMGMSRSNIAKLETGRVFLKAEDLLKWCKITNHPDVLMNLYATIEVTAPFAQLITGTITFLGGII
ncbi:hypothetical protein CHI07_16905 [Paenibacillus sp. 7884-2]|nr:hypothetical protein CHI07_16905 [Paenibacillus sp. 7884-2]